MKDFLTVLQERREEAIDEFNVRAILEWLAPSQTDNIAPIYRHDLRAYRRDSNSSMKARQARKDAAHAREYPLHVMQFTLMFAAASLAITHALFV